jgi:hypothetical protein
MFDDPRDLNRDLSGRDPYRQTLSDGSGWGAPIALLAVVIVIGALIAFAPSSNNQQTASNTPAASRSMPAPSPAAPPRPTTPSQ